MSVYFKDKPEFLKNSLESVFSQTLPPSEVVLVEDGPLTEALDEVVESFSAIHPELHPVKLEKNMGLGAALNEGLRHCHNELIARMDSDDICHEDRFECQLKFMTDNPRVAACSSWIEEFVDTPGNIVSVKSLPATHEELVAYNRKRSPLNHPAVMFRKSAIEKAGGYMHFYLFEDWYLWARIIATGGRIANIQRSLLYFRTTPDMYKRRGGWKYAKSSAKFQYTLYKLGIISLPAVLISSTARGLVYMLPNSLRKWVYNTFLRHH